MGEKTPGGATVRKKVLVVEDEPVQIHIRLPGGDGYTVLHRLKALGAVGRTRAGFVLS